MRSNPAALDELSSAQFPGGMTEGLDNEIEGWDIGAGVKAMW
jgi:hypothetical protein